MPMTTAPTRWKYHSLRIATCSVEPEKCQVSRRQPPFHPALECEPPGRLVRVLQAYERAQGDFSVTLASAQTKATNRKRVSKVHSSPWGLTKIDDTGLMWECHDAMNQPRRGSQGAWNSTVSVGRIALQQVQGRDTRGDTDTNEH